jgi:putative ABC transport system permease protein
MFWNYLKIAIRNLVRQRIYAIINVIGLAFGLAAVLIIALYIQHEVGYDRHIPYGDRVYRCVEIQKPAGIPEQHVAVIMGPLAGAMTSDFPEVELTTRMLYWGARPMVYNGKQYNQEYTIFADPSVLDMFGIRLILGDPATAMTEPRSLVISESVAKKVFGSPEAAMGEVVSFDDREVAFAVTAIMEDQPEQSHFQMQLLVPMAIFEERFPYLKSWDNNTLDTYLRLKPNADVKSLEAKFPAFIDKYTDSSEDWEWSLYLQPVHDIHLQSGHIKFQVQNYKQGSLWMVYIFGVTGLLIIVMACINFINMAIARSVKRAREVGMRKVMGANRWNLAYQFLGESVILTIIAVIIALVVVELMLPSISRILDIPLHIDFIRNWIFNIGLIGLILAVSLISGSYPALYLSRFQPIRVLKGRSASQGRSTGYLTKALVVLQFAITIGLLFCISIIYRQYQFMIGKDLGFNHENVLVVPLYANNSPEETERIRDRLILNPDVLNFSFSAGSYGMGGDQSSLNIDDSVKTAITCRMGWVDYDFFPMMKVPVVEGRNFSKQYALDEQEAIILNETAVKTLGWDDPIGKTFMPIGDTIHKRKVIGVVGDYHYNTLHTKIEPAVYLIMPDRTYVALIKVSAGRHKEVIAFLEKTWAELFPGVPLEYYPFEDIITKNYSNEANILKIFTYLTILSIIISLLGLYGLTSLQTERRTREIGIRKAFGGSPWQIVSLVLKDFLVLIGISAVVIIPVSWYFLNQALDNFAYRIAIGADIALFSTLAVILIGILTILYHVLRAANTNPINALRYE